MKKMLIDRRRLITGGSALAAYAALAGRNAFAQTCPPPPPPGDGQVETLGVNTGTGITATASTTVGQMGQLATIGTSSFAYAAFTVYLTPPGPQRYVVNIVGNVASQNVVLVSNIVIDNTSQPEFSQGQVFCPVSVPAGTTLSFQIASSVGGAILTAMITGMSIVPAGVMSGQANMVAVNDFITTSPYVDPVCQIPNVGHTISAPYAINPVGYPNLPQLSALTIELTSCGTNEGVVGGGYVEIGVGPNAQSVTWLFPVETETGSRRIEGPYPNTIPAGTQLWARAWSDKNVGEIWGVAALGTVA